MRITFAQCENTPLMRAKTTRGLSLSSRPGDRFILNRHGKKRQKRLKKRRRQKARLLPPQIAQVAGLLGNDFNGIFTDDEMIQRIKEIQEA